MDILDIFDFLDPLDTLVTINTMDTLDTFETLDQHVTRGGIQEKTLEPLFLPITSLGSYSIKMPLQVTRFRPPFQVVKSG